MITIAIAEDTPQHIERLTAMIGRNENFKIIKHTWDEKSMIKWLEETKTYPDVLIADYEMNPMDGLQVTQFVRHTFCGHNIRILALSSHDHEFAVRSMLECGAIGYQTKYILHGKEQKENDDILYNAIETVANNEFYTDQFLGDGKICYKKTNIFQVQNAYDYNLKYRINYYKLSEFEYTILFLFCCGFITRELAETTNLSIKTIEGHLSRIKTKLKIFNDRDLTLQVIRTSLVPSARYETISYLDSKKMV